MISTKDTAAVATKTTRTRRAMDLYRDRGHEIEQTGPRTYSVPSCTGGHYYEVSLQTGRCECPDRVPAGQVCKHVGAALIAFSKLSRRPAPEPRPVRVDEALLDEIADLTGVAYRALSSAFLGFPAENKNDALDVVKAAVSADPEGGPESWELYILAWAKREGRGQYHPDMLDVPEITYEANDHERRIGRRA